MNQPLGGSSGESAKARPVISRERELEIELARVRAELDDARGKESAAATSRFLSMAAATVDLALEDARREVDELVVELSAEAERRRDEAVRIATEAEVTVERLQTEAEAARTAAQQVTVAARRELDRARAEAQALIDDARAEADELRSCLDTEVEAIAADRARVQEELQHLTETRTSLEEERRTFEEYHEALRARAQDLAESMVAFMTNELPDGLTGAFEGSEASGRSAGLGTGEAEPTDAPTAAPSSFAVEEPEPEDEPAPSGDTAAEPEEPEPLSAPAPSIFGASRATESAAESDYAALPGFQAAAAPAPPAPESTPEPTVSASAPESAARVLPAPVPEPSPAPTDDTEPPMTHPFDSSTPGAQEPPDGLFASATPEERDLGADGGSSLSALFSGHGARLVQQTEPSDLADALADDDSEDDERFRSFLEGDDAEDPSRDWLLRPESP